MAHLAQRRDQAHRMQTLRPERAHQVSEAALYKAGLRLNTGHLFFGRLGPAVRKILFAVEPQKVHCQLKRL